MIYACDYLYRRHREQFSQYGVKVIHGPTVEPITLAEAKLHLRVDDDGGSPPNHPDDTLITAQIKAAREWCEGDLGLSLAIQTLELGRGSFVANYHSSNQMILPYGPIASIESVKYLDGDNVEQTIAPADFIVDAYSQPAMMYAATSWPTTYAVPNAVKIRYTAGYSLPGESPQSTEPLPWSLRAMMLLVLGHLYEQREATAAAEGGALLHEIPLGAKSLGDRYRVRLGMA